MFNLVRQFSRAAFDKMGIETDRSTTLRRFISSHPIDLVIDAGANEGQFARLMRGKGYRGRIWSFEPVRDVFECLSAAAQADRNWTASNFALGSEDCQLQINVPSNHTLSSFLAPNDNMRAYDGNGETRTETVAMRRLDDVLVSDRARHIFLKADVQGFEKQVLDGATETLARTEAIYLELPIEHLYDGSWSFPEAIAYLDRIGFTPAQFRTVTPLPNDRASATEFDCLLRRKSPA